MQPLFPAGSARVRRYTGGLRSVEMNGTGHSRPKTWENRLWPHPRSVPPYLACPVLHPVNERCFSFLEPGLEGGAGIPGVRLLPVKYLYQEQYDTVPRRCDGTSISPMYSMGLQSGCSRPQEGVVRHHTASAQPGGQVRCIDLVQRFLSWPGFLLIGERSLSGRRFPVSAGLPASRFFRCRPPPAAPPVWLAPLARVQGHTPVVV